jgi:hypothetical protein
MPGIRPGAQAVVERRYQPGHFTPFTSSVPPAQRIGYDILSIEQSCGEAFTQSF